VVDSFDPIAYLYNLQHFGVKFGLSRMERLMEVLGHPHNVFASVHVAGTNGKGSICAMLNSVLSCSGRKVGLYTSPHLVDFCERIQIDSKKISVSELREIVIEIKQKLDSYDNAALNDDQKFGEITFFEFTTAAAFVYFAKMGVDVAVLEVGLGGRLDATNVVNSLVSVITNIDLDHTKVLGDTREKIAIEKAGVIKKGVPLVCGEKNSEIVKLFSSICAELDSILSKVDYSYSLGLSDLGGQKFSLGGKEYELGLLGSHQIENACVVIKVCEVLNGLGFVVSSDSIAAGLRDAKWPGRLQVYPEKSRFLGPKGSHSPLVIFDGAHNYAGMKRLQTFLQEQRESLPAIENRVVIFGLSTGKSARQMSEYLAEEFDHFIITEAGHRAQKKEDVAKESVFYEMQAMELSCAWDRALELVGDSGMILVCGSLYLVGDLMKLLEERNSKNGAKEKKELVDLKGAVM
jgi:dihydrofolate synthase / folylpolyglutamate synthase